jgi:cytochrome c oxidase subunit IV
MKKETSKSTVFVISMGFLVLHFIFTWHWAVIVSLAFGTAGIISDTLSRKIEWAWMKLARILSYIIPSILLGIIFYLILFPLSFISKFFTKDPLMLSKNYNTYFVKIENKFDKKNMEKIW